MATSAIKIALLILFVILILSILIVPMVVITLIEDDAKELKIVASQSTKAQTQPTGTTESSATTTLEEIIAPLMNTAMTLSPEETTGPESDCTDAFVALRLSPLGPTPDNVPACNLLYVGDGFCDGACNTPDHNFDNGDCCGNSADFSYCSVELCECYCYEEGKQYTPEITMVTAAPPSPPPPPSGPPTIGPLPTDGTCSNAFVQLKTSPVYVGCNPSYKGDGYCDGDCNTPADNFDDGDCCLEDINLEYCDLEGCECYCYLEGKQYYPTPGGVTNDCPVEFIGDGWCDGGCNIEPPYDGGDCCLETININFCNLDEGECLCKDLSIVEQMPTRLVDDQVCPNAPEISNPEEPIESCSEAWLGDGFCDQGCNNEFNKFDHGDCCTETINTSFCSGDVKCGCYCFADDSLHPEHSASDTNVIGPPAPPPMILG